MRWARIIFYSTRLWNRMPGADELMNSIRPNSLPFSKAVFIASRYCALVFGMPLASAMRWMVRSFTPDFSLRIRRDHRRAPKAARICSLVIIMRK